MSLRSSVYLAFIFSCPVFADYYNPSFLVYGDDLQQVAVNELDLIVGESSTSSDKPFTANSGATATENAPVEEVFVEPEVKRVVPEITESLLDQRAEIEKQTSLNPFVITPHRPNYFLPIHYQSDIDGNDLSDNDGELDNIEFVFQLSIKFPVAYNVLGANSGLWMAYTQKAFWQAYNSEISAPFRETNHEPEIFVVKNFKQNTSSFIPKYISFGANHNSNGQDGSESRSWNRIFAELYYETERAIISIKPWYRLPEKRSNNDNPDIVKYYGHGEFNVIYLLGDYRLNLMVRNNFRKDNKGALEVGYTFPLWGQSQGFVQYFTGYGQSLIEYDQYRTSLGIGIMISNW